MITELIKLFKVVPVGKNTEKIDPTIVNSLASRAGYIVHPDACIQDVMDFIEDQSVNYDSTFYKTWVSVTSKSREELFLDQLVHYALSYGSNITWVPNEECIIPEITTYKLILPVTEKEMYDRCLKMLQTGIALSSNTMKALADYVIYYSYVCDESLDVDSIKNKEALIYICNELKITPEDKFNLLRYIFYKTTKQTLMINNRETHNMLACAWYDKEYDFNFSQLSEIQLRGLASIFFRFKYIFLGLRKRSLNKIKNSKGLFDIEEIKNVKIINTLRRMANKYHKPMKIGYWEDLLSTVKTDKDLDDLRTNVKEVSNYKIITLLQTILNRQSLLTGNAPAMYVIRNSKVYIKHHSDLKKTDSESLSILTKVYNILYNQLIRNLSKKACNVKFPKLLNLACPVSEKNFVGDIPFGSYFDIANRDNILGIYWRNEDGCRDLDLSFMDYTGRKVGWNASYYTYYKNGRCPQEDIIYSGDMTNADPCATELMFARAKCPNGIFKVNKYSGLDGGKYKFFFAQEHVGHIDKFKNYMVDPNNIKVSVDLEASGEQMVGVVCDNKLYLMSFTIGRDAVSKVESNDEIDKIFKQRATSTVLLKQVLLDAGFKEVKEESEENPIELDLTDLHKDTLIDLFN